ncbi:MAG: AAA-like domain-containing protein, partial [Pseudomonadota bacterium]
MKASKLQAGGTLNPSRHLYIDRREDELLFKLLMEGEYVNVLTSRQMGKSSLMVRTALKLRDHGVRFVSVDLAGELGGIVAADDYYLGLIDKISRDLRLSLNVKKWWDEHASETQNQKFMGFFRDIVVGADPSPVVVFLDEIDSTLKLDFTDDLFTSIRSMYNERTLIDAYSSVTFCLLGVATPNELIKERRTTPYNVGNTLELRDFDLTIDDLSALRAALDPVTDEKTHILNRVLYWTGGHPYLTMKLCSDLANLEASANEDVDTYIDQAFGKLDRVSGDSHFQQILRFLETRLSNGLESLTLYERILSGNREKDQPALSHAELKLSGLVQRNEDGHLVVRNRIYGRLFDSTWIKSTRPRRTITRYRRFGIATSVALISVLFAAGAYQFVVLRPEQQELAARLELEAMGITITALDDFDGSSINFPETTTQFELANVASSLGLIGPISEIKLSGTQVADVAPLANLSSLQSLFLYSTQVADVAPLANLSSLQILFLSGTQVADVAPLANLSSLQSLFLSGTQVADVAPLASLSSLQTLD